jgi:hypothetical protein
LLSVVVVEEDGERAAEGFTDANDTESTSVSAAINGAMFSTKPRLIGVVQWSDMFFVGWHTNHVGMMGGGVVVVVVVVEVVVVMVARP